jgi:hypothetical protein
MLKKALLGYLPTLLPLLDFKQCYFDGQSTACSRLNIKDHLPLSREDQSVLFCG